MRRVEREEWEGAGGVFEKEERGLLVEKRNRNRHFVVRKKEGLEDKKKR